MKTRKDLAMIEHVRDAAIYLRAAMIEIVKKTSSMGSVSELENTNAELRFQIGNLKNKLESLKL